MRILVVNAGSTSVKIEIFDRTTHVFSENFDSKSGERELEDILASIPDYLAKIGYLEFDGIGHRIAHGGAHFSESCLINDEVLKAIESCSPLAPLHNPPNLAGIEMARKHWPKAAQVAVFDTAFHHTLPEKAYTYPLPQEWREMGARHYGFHGTSHHYIMERAAEELGRNPEELLIISAHLGGGASLCAIDRGRSVDTSMGMTALSGLVMATRSGDIDPGLFGFLKRRLGLEPEDVEDILYHNSGLKALAGSGDLCEVEKIAEDGDAGAKLALDVFAYSVRKYIGAYAAVMNGLDVLVFTGGIGEHSAEMRARICCDMDFIGIELDREKNSAPVIKDYAAPQIQKETSRVKILVTETREQWMIARDVLRIVGDMQDRNMKKEAMI